MKLSSTNGRTWFGSPPLWALAQQLGESSRKKLQSAMLLSMLLAVGPSVSGQDVIAGWDFGTLPGGTNNFGPSPFGAGITDASVTVVGISREVGVGTTGTGSANGWGGNDFDEGTDLATAVSNNNVVYFSVTPNAGKSLSFSSIDPYNIRRSGGGPTTGIWQYKLGAGSFVTIGSAITWGGVTTSSGNAQTAIDLSAITALQKIPAGTTVTFRVVNWSAAATGTWYFNDPEDDVTNDLVVKGSIFDCSSNPPIVIGALDGATCVSNTLAVDGLPTGGSGTYSSHFWTDLGGSATGVVLSNTTSQTVSASATGAGNINLNYRVTDSEGCVGSDGVLVTVNPLPTGTLSASPNPACLGSNVTLTATGGYDNYEFFIDVPPSVQNGASNTYVSNAIGEGDHDLQVVVTENGCTATFNATQQLTINGLPSVSITPGGPTTFCAGGSVLLTATSGANSYVWRNNGVAIPGQTASTTTVSSSGSYTVDYTDANGCVGVSSAVIVTVNNVATPTISNSTPLSFCQGGSVLLTSTASAGNQWKLNGTDIPGAVNSTYSATAAGSYTVVVTANGCTSLPSAAKVVVVHALPSPTITANPSLTICAGSSVVLTSSGAVSYLWSNAGTNQSTTVTTAGNYTVQVTDDNGCTGLSAPATVVVNPVPVPVVSANVPLPICAGAPVTLSSSAAGSTYAWSNGATTATITVNPASTTSYTVVVTDANGCVGTSAAFSVTVNSVPMPVITASAPAICAGGSVTLSSSITGSAHTYAWSPGGANTSAITVSLGMTTEYTLVVTETATGCTGSDVHTVTVNSLPDIPTISAGGATTFCFPGTVVLTSSAAPVGGGYAWNTGGATTQSINVAASGSYIVTVNNATGCTRASAPTTVTVNPLPDVPTISGSPTTVCTPSTVLLTSSAAPVGGSYFWSPSGGTGQTATLSATGNYTVQVSTAAGCTATSAPTMVTINPLPTPTITAGGPLAFCQGGSVTLTASSATGYLWTGGQTTQSITVAASGNYSVTVTDGNGCQGVSTATTVTVTPLPVPTIGGPTSICSGGSAVLTSSTPAGTTGYLWSTGETTPSITVTTAGPFTVTVTANGCSGASAPKSIAINPVPNPPPTITGTPTACAPGTVTLMTGAPTTRAWLLNDVVISGQTGASLSGITVSGAYKVRTTNAFGCSATSAATNVVVHPAAVVPTISAGGPTTFCAPGTVVLTSSAATGNLWNSGGATSQSITVSTSGSYMVTATDVNGCTAASAPTTVTVNPLPDVPTISGSPITVCTPSTVMLTSSAAPVGGSYFWSPAGGTGQTATLSATGNYTVQVSTAAGCTATSAPTMVTINPLPTPEVIAAGPTEFCAGSSVGLSSSVAGSAYLWMPGSLTTPTITATSGGSYTVQVTDAVTGCSGTSPTLNVVVHDLPPTPTVTVTTGDLELCAGETVTLTSSSASNNQWKKDGNPIVGETGQTLVAGAAGAYTVEVSNAAGCIANSVAQTVIVHALPTPIVSGGGPLTFCDPGSVVLTSSIASNPPNTTLLWSNSATTTGITVDASGMFSVMVTDQYGCVGTSPTVTVTENPLPTGMVSVSPNPSCVGSMVTFTAPSGNDNYNFKINGLSEQNGTISTYMTSLAPVGDNDYEVEVTKNGCSAILGSGQFTVEALPTPTISPAGPISLCNGGSVVLTSSSATGNMWSNGETTSSITVTSAGSYSVVVTNGAGCMGSSASVEVTTNPVPNFGFTATVTGSGSPQTVNNNSGPATVTLAFCAGGTFSHSAFTSTPSGIKFQETLASTGNVTYGGGGVPAGPTSPVVLTAAYFNGTVYGPYGLSSGTSGSITEVFTPFIDLNSNNVMDMGECQGSAITVVYNIAALPTVVATPASETICSGETTDIDLTSNLDPATTFNWEIISITGTVGGAVMNQTGTGASIAETLTNIGPGVATVTYRIIPTTPNNCVGNPLDVVVTVNPLPTLSAITGFMFAPENETTQLSNSTSGGTWESLSPTIATVDNTGLVYGLAAGMAQVKYTITDGGTGCVNSVTANVTVGNSIFGLGIYKHVAASPVGNKLKVKFTPAIDIPNTPGGYVSGVFTLRWLTPVPPAPPVTLNFVGNLAANNGYTMAMTGANGGYTYQVFVKESASAIVGTQGVPTDLVTLSYGCVGNVTFELIDDAFAATLFGENSHVLFIGGSIYDHGDAPFSPSSATGSSAFTAVANVTENVQCFGGMTGEITVTAMGGEPSYTGTGDFTGLAAGMHSFPVSDANGCSVNASATISSPTLLVAVASNIVQPTCSGGTGSVDISATGGIPGYTGIGTQSNLAPGMHTFTVTDMNGCTATQTVTITAPSSVVALETHTDVLCHGGNTGTAEITGSGGVSPYSGDIGSKTGLVAGPHSYTIMDANGCSAMVTVNIGQPDALVGTASAASTSVSVGQPIDLNSSTAGGTAPFVYDWEGPNAYDNTVANPAAFTATGLTNGAYSLTVTDGNGCSNISSVTVNVRIMVNAKVFLQGPYKAAEDKMSDDLRKITVAPPFHFPISQPYTQYSSYVAVNNPVSEVITTTVRDNNDANNAIVDWVWLELRNTASGAAVATRAALVQRDGDIVDMDGVSDVSFPTTTVGSYHLMIRHRNHLGAATKNLVDFAAAVAPVVDFRSASLETFGATVTSARKLLEPGVYGLYSGNTNLITGGSPQVKSSGAGNDILPITNLVGSSTFISGYYLQDVNLNGNVRSSGSANDPLQVLGNAISPARLQEPTN